jgi:U3 small nucleolar RNA-associated protein 4
VFELDLLKLRAKNVRSSFGGAVWSMALNHAQTTLAIGCEDGCIRMFTIEDGELEYKKSFPATSGNII